MKELTRISTIRITAIDKSEESNFTTKEEVKKAFLEDFKRRWDVDDVVVDNVQDFVREVE